MPSGVLGATSTLPDFDCPGLKALADFRLKGVLTYCESLHSFESGTHENRNLFVKTAHSCILLEFLRS